MDIINLRPRAKINLALDVLRRREDGYHEVRMIMQSINLYDKIEIRKINNKSGIVVKTNLPYLPTNENNLVYKAAQKILDHSGIDQGIFIKLDKYIPVSAGMAGGSTDAAAVLYGMNKMLKLGLTMQQLMDIGLTLGADIPYCLMGGTALAEGIGEVLTPISSMPDCYILIAKPSINVSTAFVYKNLNANEIQNHPDIDGMIDAIENNDIYGVASRLGNVLENVTIKEYPIIDEIKRTMTNLGAIGVLMSGSGPTVFGMFDDKGKARSAYYKLKARTLAKQIYLTNIYNRRG